MRKISGLLVMSALTLVGGAFGLSDPPRSQIGAIRAEMAPAPGFTLDSIMLRWNDGVSESARQSILDLAGAHVISVSSDGKTFQLGTTDTTAAMGVLTEFMPNAVESAASAREFIQDTFGLSGFELVSIDLGATRGADAVQIPVTVNGSVELLVLERHSMRAANFRVLVDQGNGVLVEAPAPAPTTFRGTLDGSPMSVVAASINNGLSAVVDSPESIVSEWTVQPLSKVFDGAPADAHIVYVPTQVVDQHKMCGGALAHDAAGAIINAAEEMERSQGQRVRKICELAYDADYEFYQRNGSSVNNTIADIENVQNAVTLIYERDCDVTFTITTIIVRSDINDPYTSSDAATLLNQFRNHWQSSQGGVQRDLAHLMTGRNIDGGTIGIAWLSAVCTSNGYGLSESRFTSNFNQRVALTAHEIGHNFSANHCNGNGDCKIMCSGLGGCNGIGLPNFGAPSAATINNYAQSRSCLANGGGNQAPTVTILLPNQGASYEQTTSVFMIGSASDPEDNNTVLTNQIVWSSNVQGQLGVGASISRSDLVVGPHTITASVTDSGGLSGSATRSITITPIATPPSPPSTNRSTETVTGTAFISWFDNSSNEDGFIIERQRLLGGVWGSQVTVTSTAANITSFLNFPGEGIWRYRVRAFNNIGDSVNSPWEIAKPRNPTVQNPTVSGGNVTVTWNDNSIFEDGYDVQREQLVGSNWVNATIVASLPANSTSHVEAPGSGTWRYSVRSRASTLIGGFSAPRTIVVP